MPAENSAVDAVPPYMVLGKWLLLESAQIPSVLAQLLRPQQAA
jgi:hypothetical protein